MSSTVYRIHRPQTVACYIHLHLYPYPTGVPVPVQAQFSHDGGTSAAQTAATADTGTSLTISVNSPMHLTCTHAALDSSLRALAWWRNAAASSDSGALHRHAAAADNAVVLTEVHNAVGEPLKMWMDFGDRTHVAELSKGVQRLMQPLVRPVPRVLNAAPAEEVHRPTMLLSITLDDFHHAVQPLNCLWCNACLHVCSRMRAFWLGLGCVVWWCGLWPCHGYPEGLTLPPVCGVRSLLALVCSVPGRGPCVAMAWATVMCVLSVCLSLVRPPWGSQACFLYPCGYGVTANSFFYAMHCICSSYLPAQVHLLKHRYVCRQIELLQT